MSTQKKLIPPKELFQEQILHKTELILERSGQKSETTLPVSDIDVGGFFVLRRELFRRILDVPINGVMHKNFFNMRTGEICGLFDFDRVNPVYLVDIVYTEVPSTI